MTYKQQIDSVVNAEWFPTYVCNLLSYNHFSSARNIIDLLRFNECNTYIVEWGRIHTSMEYADEAFNCDEVLQYISSHPYVQQHYPELFI